MPRVKITLCYAQDNGDTEYEKIVPDSVHETLPVPKGKIPRIDTVWVQGQTKPVILYSNEFKLLSK